MWVKMDFSIYIESIVDKMKKAGFYSEVEEKELKKQIERYLKEEYNKRVEVAGFKYDLSISNGQPQSMEDVKTALAEIKTEMISLIRELSRTDL